MAKKRKVKFVRLVRRVIVPAWQTFRIAGHCGCYVNESNEMQYITIEVLRKVKRKKKG